MRILVQRVSSASVEVEGKTIGSIGTGLLLFVGFGRSDTAEILPAAVRKVIEMRIFSDREGKMNLSLQDIQGSALVVSQFTLYGNCTRGRRPDFTPAADPQTAEELYNSFIQQLTDQGIPTQTGSFAADMKVSLCNDGPVTFHLEF